MKTFTVHNLAGNNPLIIQAKTGFDAIIKYRAMTNTFGKIL